MLRSHWRIQTDTTGWNRSSCRAQCEDARLGDQNLYGKVSGSLPAARYRLCQHLVEVFSRRSGRLRVWEPPAVGDLPGGLSPDEKTIRRQRLFRARGIHLGHGEATRTPCLGGSDAVQAQGADDQTEEARRKDAWL